MSSKVQFDLLPIEEERRDLQSGDRIFGTPEARAQVPRFPGTPESEHSQKMAGIGFEVTSSVLGTLISHPCIVLRRQCQVNGNSMRYHLSPFTLLPVIMRMQARQGLHCLWKGSGGFFILRGCSVVLETAIAELTPFPREVSSSYSLKHLAQHLLLKCIAYGILTPFYCSSLVETVQSDIASEKPGVFDCLKEGVRRLLHWGTPRSTRLLPVWHLILPTAAYGLSVYVISAVVHTVFQWVLALRLRKRQRLREQEGCRDVLLQTTSEKYFNNLSAMYFASMVANIVTFPAETILHRLYLQGTRTIIDNLDSGTSVLPVITKYEGVADCFHTIVAEEGASGLYKGFGALILEYTLQACILKLARLVFQEIEHLIRPPLNDHGTAL